MVNKSATDKTLWK